MELRRGMRAYVHGLLAPVGRKKSWQLAEHAGYRTPSGLQHLLSRARWNADEIRDDLQAIEFVRGGGASALGAEACVAVVFTLLAALLLRYIDRAARSRATVEVV